MRLMDYHTHTRHSFDGKQTIPELCEAMLSAGVTECCLTEHYDQGYDDPLINTPPVWENWLADYREAKARYPALALRLGVEIGDVPAYRDAMRQTVDALPLDFRLLSLHLVNGLDPYDSARFFGERSRDAAYRDYARAVAEAALAWEDYDSVAHVGYVGRYAPYPDKPLVWANAPDELDTLLRHLAETGRCLEINTQSLDSLGCLVPHPSIIRRFLELGGECFTIGSDAHTADRDGFGLREAAEQLKALGARWQVGFDQRKRQVWPL
ncbi:MAG: histidinol-phosphatase HisJ family protein [Clostridia bacterium]|nr:histidinol-phosphatase HisJ family protein [Clostridia bacterium]